MKVGTELTSDLVRQALPTGIQRARCSAAAGVRRLRRNSTLNLGPARGRMGMLRPTSGATPSVRQCETGRSQKGRRGFPEMHHSDKRGRLSAGPYCIYHNIHYAYRWDSFQTPRKTSGQPRSLPSASPNPQQERSQRRIGLLLMTASCLVALDQGMLLAACCT